MTIREYTYTAAWADGTIHTDSMYVDNGDRTAWNVQDYPTEHLAVRLDRKHVAMWLRIRRLAGRPMTGEMVKGPYPDRYVDRHGRAETRLHAGWFHRRTQSLGGYPLEIPNKPVSEYARNKIVLHGEGMTGYSYRNGETAGGAQYQEMRLDAGTYDDLHRHTECYEHGTDCPCTVCGHNATLSCPADCECEHYNLDCEECQLIYNCDQGNCRCIESLETCGECGRDLGDGANVWLCMDGSEFYCDEHIVHDARPDSLFERVGGVRGAMLPAFAWPGGYCIVYYTEQGGTVCAECASEVDTSDPAIGADADEEMNCIACDHAQSDHARIKVPGLDEKNGDDVGPCGYAHHGECDCPAYMPPQCDDCGLSIDPALRVKTDPTTTVSAAVSPDADTVRPAGCSAAEGS